MDRQEVDESTPSRVSARAECGEGSQPKHVNCDYYDTDGRCWLGWNFKRTTLALMASEPRPLGLPLHEQVGWHKHKHKHKAHAAGDLAGAVRATWSLVLPTEARWRRGVPNSALAAV